MMKWGIDKMNWDINYIEQEGIKLQNKKEKWIEQRIEMGGDKKVIQFIADILFHGGNGIAAEDSIETTRCLFEAGYCYYFAKILEDAFPGGDICLCYPFSHIIYVYEGIAYDIGGVSDAEKEMYIPISELGDNINGFRHIPGLIDDTNKDKVYDIGEKCKKNGTIVYAISAYDEDIVNRTKAILTIEPEPKYMQSKVQFILTKGRLEKDLKKGYITKKQFHKFMDEECISLGISYPFLQRMKKEESEKSNLPKELKNAIYDLENDTEMDR